MLKVKGIVRDTTAKFTPISGAVMRVSDNVVVETQEGQGTWPGAVLNFHREDGGRIRFDEDRIVHSVNGSFRYWANGFPDIPLFFESCEIITKKISPTSQNTNFLKLSLKNEHCYLKNRDDVEVNGYIDCEFQSAVPDNNVAGRFCSGDTVIYNDIFSYLLRGSNNTETLSTGTLENYKTTVYFEDENGVTLLNAMVPCDLGGKDVLDTILLYGNDEIISKIARNPFSYTIYGKDERFFTESTSFTEGETEEDRATFINLSLKEGTNVRWRTGDMRLNVPIGQDFDVTLNQEEAISQFIEEKAYGTVNPIVDYEKQQFVPVYDSFDLAKIVYKIHLRDRGTNFEGEDYEWKTNDNLGWYNSTDIYKNMSGDSVYFMGFDEDDIYYQKKKVTETFLRVSIYNTPDRRTQKLLYTAKIYINSANLYGEYIENLTSSGKTRFLEEMVSISGNPLSTIETQFVCTHKYDPNEAFVYTHKYDPNEATEGFYFHLFPSNLDNYVGEWPPRVYMKCELNNAKYGMSIPLVLFSDGFKAGYLKETGGSFEVEMNELYKDLYIPIKISRNNEKDRYEWEFIGDVKWEAEDNAVTLNLFEPRVNGFRRT